MLKIEFAEKCCKCSRNPAIYCYDCKKGFCSDCWAKHKHPSQKYHYYVRSSDGEVKVIPAINKEAESNVDMIFKEAFDTIAPLIEKSKEKLEEAELAKETMEIITNLNEFKWSPHLGEKHCLGKSECNREVADTIMSLKSKRFKHTSDEIPELKEELHRRELLKLNLGFHYENVHRLGRRWINAVELYASKIEREGES
jgi:hypothetical protein